MFECPTKGIARTKAGHLKVGHRSQAITKLACDMESRQFDQNAGDIDEPLQKG
jgi:hypothetical protein